MVATLGRKPGRRGSRDGAWSQRFSEALTARPRIDVPAWAERYRVLGDESPEPGPWQNWRTPYLVGPMQAFSDPGVETIVCCFAAQCGKTEFQNNCLGYIAMEEPGTTLVAFPSERSADKHIKSRVHPMILQSEELKRRLAPGPDSLGIKEIHFDRCSVYTAWSNSPDSMSSTPCRYVIVDEADAFAAYAGGKHGNPIELLSARTRAYKGRNKILIVSTPTVEYGYVWPLWLKSNRQLHHVPCPHCGEYQALEFPNLKWQKKCSPLEVYEQNLAWYECAHCKEEIRPQQKREMVSRGVWCPAGQHVNRSGELEGPSPPKIRSGFRLPVLYSPMVTWGEVAKEWIESLGDQGAIHNFFNLSQALPYEQKRKPVTVAKINQAKRKYPAGTVPVGALKLTAGIDVQMDHFWYVVRAWGLKERSWLVRYGMCLSFPEVEAVLMSGYPSVEGDRQFVVTKACIDSRYRMSEVHEFVRPRFPRVIATMGSGHPAMVHSKMPSHPEPGILRYTFKADLYKDKLSSLIEGRGGEEPEWAVFDGVEDDYVQQMTSEEKKFEVKNGRKFYTWKAKTDTTPNHLWDAEVLAVLAAELSGVPYLHLQKLPEPEVKVGPSAQGAAGEWFGGDSLRIEGGKPWFGG